MIKISLYAILVPAAFLAGIVGVSAETVTPDEAKRVADEFLGVGTQPTRMVRRSASGAVAKETQPYYVFNSQTENEGFILYFDKMLLTE